MTNGKSNQNDKNFSNLVINKDKQLKTVLSGKNLFNLTQSAVAR